MTITTTSLTSLSTVATPTGHPPVTAILSSTRALVQSRSLSRIIRKRKSRRKDMMVPERTPTLLITKLMRRNLTLQEPTTLRSLHPTPIRDLQDTKMRAVKVRMGKLVMVTQPMPRSGVRIEQQTS